MCFKGGTGEPEFPLGGPYISRKPSSSPRFSNIFPTTTIALEGGGNGGYKLRIATARVSAKRFETPRAPRNLRLARTMERPSDKMAEGGNAVSIGDFGALPAETRTTLSGVR